MGPELTWERKDQMRSRELKRNGNVMVLNLLVKSRGQYFLSEEKAKIFKITKTGVIKVVQEEAEKIGLDPKKIISAKAGEKFKKARDAEH
ncbi:hypothetical protein Tco_0658063 [Tanacetum coccineum]